MFSRLTAPLAFVIAFIATWLRHLGSGPLWKYFITNGVTAQCRAYYWAHLFYFNNLIQDDKFCVLQTWYGSDTKYFLIKYTFASTSDIQRFERLCISRHRDLVLSLILNTIVLGSFSIQIILFFYFPIRQM